MNDVQVSHATKISETKIVRDNILFLKQLRKSTAIKDLIIITKLFVSG